MMLSMRLEKRIGEKLLTLTPSKLVPVDTRIALYRPRTKISPCCVQLALPSRLRFELAEIRLPATHSPQCRDARRPASQNRVPDELQMISHIMLWRLRTDVAGLATISSSACVFRDCCVCQAPSGKYWALERPKHHPTASRNQNTACEGCYITELRGLSKPRNMVPTFIEPLEPLSLFRRHKWTLRHSSLLVRVDQPMQHLGLPLRKITWEGLLTVSVISLRPKHVPICRHAILTTP